MLSFREWHPTIYKVPGGGDEDVITFEVRRLRYAERAEFNRVFLPAMRQTVGSKDDFDSLQAEADAAKAEGREMSAQTAAKLTEIMSDMFCAYDPKWVEGIFSSHVRNVGGVEDGDGIPITTGEGLYAIADDSLAQNVILRVHTISSLSASEGKDSGSPSTSTDSSRGEPGELPAGSAEPGDGTAHATAPEIQSDATSSSPQDEDPGESPG